MSKRESRADQPSFKDRRGYQNVRVGFWIVLLSYVIGLGFAPLAFAYLLEQANDSTTQVPLPYLIVAAAYRGLYLLGVLYFVYAPRSSEKTKAIISILTFVFAIWIGIRTREYGAMELVLSSILGYVSVLYVVGFCQKIGNNLECMELANRSINARLWTFAFLLVAGVTYWVWLGDTANGAKQAPVNMLKAGLVFATLATAAAAIYFQVRMLITGIRTIGGNFK